MADGSSVAVEIFRDIYFADSRERNIVERLEQRTEELVGRYVPL